MKQELEFVSGAANTVSQGALWLRAEEDGRESDLFAFAVHNLIAIADMGSYRVSHTLRGHTASINTIAKLGKYIVSGGEDSTVRIWLPSDHQAVDVLSNPLKGSVIALACLQTEAHELIAAADATGRLVIWGNSSSRISGSKLDKCQVLKVVDIPPAQMPKDLHFAVIPSPKAQSDVALFVGAVDAKIHVRVSSSADINHALLTPAADASHSVLFSSVGSLPGHEEWVTTFDSVAIDSRNLMLVSGSQDSKIRIWKITAVSVTNNSSAGSGALASDDRAVRATGKEEASDEATDDEAEELLDAPDDAVVLAPDEILSEARLAFEVSSSLASGGDGTTVAYSVYLEALLIGHEDWVTSVRWMVPSDRDTGTTFTVNESELRLFSSSMDRNMIIWSANSHSGVWTPTVRVGDIGGQLGGSVGGNLLGFVGGCLSPDGRHIMGIGYGGSFHLWMSSKDDIGEEVWAPYPFLTGHFGPVNDLAWSPTSEYLVSVSSDQTCRLYAPVPTSAILVKGGAGKGEDKDKQNTITAAAGAEPDVVLPYWREISRPQIHGYDLNAVALSPDTSSYLLYSGADEKTVRVFDASLCVVEGIDTLVRREGGEGGEGKEKQQEIVIRGDVEGSVNDASAAAARRIRRAYIPELGLSNRAVDLMNKQEQTEQAARNVQGLDWKRVPLEGQLSDHTVWPEVQKLYGHDNGIVAMAISNNGKYLASTSKARDATTAAILIWDTAKYVCVGRLGGHESTVVCLRFSPDDRFLASSGKDRTLCIHMRSSCEGQEVATEGSSSSSSSAPYVTVAGQASAHKRILWACSWSSDGKLLVTGSRDGSCKVWHVSGGLPSTPIVLECLHSFSPFGGVAVTALDIGPRIPVLGDDDHSEVIAVGAESGEIQLWSINSSSSTHITSTPAEHCHGASVKKLSWRPDCVGVSLSSSSLFSSGVAKLASCGEDNCVRIFRFAL